ncbi:MAG TPA: hypothetical protein VMD79_10745 [Solirubrobacteraceae bacterium]|nr:hypothetical protein [Solirubrobacteraceae bacterium]
MAQSIEQLSFELTATALTEQERALAGLRVSAGTVLGAASIAGSFLGAEAHRGSLDAWAVLAIISFALCCGCAIWVLLPHDLALAVGGEDLLAASDDQDVRDVAEAYRTASSWLDPFVLANRRTVAQLSSWLSVSCVLLAVEVALWTVSLAG